MRKAPHGAVSPDQARTARFGRAFRPKEWNIFGDDGPGLHRQRAVERGLGHRLDSLVPE